MFAYTANKNNFARLRSVVGWIKIKMLSVYEIFYCSCKQGLNNKGTVNNKRFF